MKKFLLSLAFAATAFATTQAQVLGRHSYFHIDITTGANFASILASETAANSLNLLTRSNIFEASFEQSFRRGDINGEKIGFKDYKFLGFKAHDMFSLVQPTLKIGYISSLQGELNWGLYAAGTYRFEQFKVSPVKADNEYSNQQMQRALFGGSAFVVIGGVTKSTHVMLEAGARYNMGLDAKGVLGSKSAFNNGVTSRYAVRLTGSKLDYDFGVYAEFDHFNYLKGENMKFKRWSLGVTYCTTFGQLTR